MHIFLGASDFLLMDIPLRDICSFTQQALILHFPMLAVGTNLESFSSSIPEDEECELQKEVRCWRNKVTALQHSYPEREAKPVASQTMILGTPSMTTQRKITPQTNSTCNLLRPQATGSGSSKL